MESILLSALSAMTHLTLTKSYYLQFKDEKTEAREME